MHETLMAWRRPIGRREIEPPASDHEHVDVALLARIGSGDRAALGELYDRHCRLLFGLALRVLNNRVHAEEILQQVFLRVWRKTDAYADTVGSPVAWLAAIARRCALEHLRAEGAGAGAQVSNPIVVANRNAEAPDGSQRRVVESALATLPPIQRELLEHAYFSGFTQSELSERFAVPIETVRVHLRDGLSALRTSLAIPGETS